MPQYAVVNFISHFGIKTKEKVRHKKHPNLHFEV